MHPKQENDLNHRAFDLLLEIKEDLGSIHSRLDHIERDGSKTALKALELATSAAADVERLSESLTWTQRSGVGIVFAAVVQFFLAPF